MMAYRCTCCGHAAGSLYCACRLPFCDGCDRCRAHCACRQVADGQPTGGRARAPRPGEGHSWPPLDPGPRLGRPEHLRRAREHLDLSTKTGEPQRHLLRAIQHLLAALSEP